MSEIQIPEKLEPDCNNCQGLCCVAPRHSIEDGFPLHEDKRMGEPCQHLEMDPSSIQGLYKCQIHNNLRRLGWKTCAGYTCHGAGQSVSAFFEGMGIKWSEEFPDPENLEEINVRDNKVGNFFFGFLALAEVFRFLEHVKNHYGPSAFLRSREAVKELLPEFCRELEKEKGTIDYVNWVTVKFDSVIKDAIFGVTKKVVSTSVEPTTNSSIVPASRLSRQSKP